MIFYLNVSYFGFFQWLPHGEQGSMNIFLSFGWTRELVFRLDDLLHECILFQLPSLVFTWWTGISESSSVLNEQGGQGHYVKPGPTKPDIMVDAIWDARLCTCTTYWFTWWSNYVWLGFLLGFPVSSCWFAITKEHLLSWIRHLMP